MQKWRKREGTEDKARNKLLSSQSILFLELMRLSRYRYQYLFDYLSPIWPNLPSTSKTGKDRRTISDMNFRRLVTGYPKSSGQAGCLMKHHGNSEPGVVAVHRVKANLKIFFDARLKVEGKTPESGSRPIDILILMERYSGLVYMKAYRRVNEYTFRGALSRFGQMLPYDISQVLFVTSEPSTVEDFNQNRNETTTSLINFCLHEDMSKFNAMVKEFLEKAISSNPSFSYDQTTPYQQNRMNIPFSKGADYYYSDLWGFNRDLQKLANIMNLKMRLRTYRNKCYDISPLSKLVEQCLGGDRGSKDRSKIRRNLIRKIRLPKIFRHDFRSN